MAAFKTSAVATPSGNRKRAVTMSAAPQRDRKEDAEETSDRGDQGGLPVVIGGPIADQQQRRNGEDHAGGQRLSG